MLQGKCALITGSTQGLGLATAKRFAAAGCNIVITGLGDEREIAAMRAQIEKEHGVRTLYSAANLANVLEIERMIGTSLEAFGAIDILVNNTVVRYAADLTWRERGMHCYPKRSVVVQCSCRPVY